MATETEAICALQMQIAKREMIISLLADFSFFPMHKIRQKVNFLFHFYLNANH